MNSNRHTPSQQGLETRLMILVCDSQGSFVYFINFIVQMPAVKHPGQRTVPKLTNYKTSHQDSEFIRVHVFGNASESESLFPALRHNLLICVSKFSF